jgi:hypothetical protein
MRLPFNPLNRPLRSWCARLVAAAATLTTAAGLAVVTGGGAQAAANTIPAHVYAPYFEAWTGDSAATLSQESGAKYLTMAFLETASSGSCTAYWNGETSEPISSSTFGSDISSIQAAGGNVIPSFGGYTADTTNTDIADSCTDVGSIAAVYESLATTYNVTRIDLDIEANSLTNTAGYTRRNEAVAQAESWAAANGRTLQFSYTMPVTPTGLTSSEVSILQNAVAEGAKVNVVNIMTFDYYIGTTQEMGTDTETAAQGLYNQLASLYPSDSSSQLWGMIGVTEMPGIDDYGAAETFTEADATTVENWAASQGIAEISIWALQRDNGGCPGTAGAGTCSGISQNTWYFSDTFDPFTSGGSGGNPPPNNGFSVSVSPASGSVTAGSSATTTVGTAVTSGSAQSVALSASGLPAGASASFSPSSVTAGGSSTLTITTAASTPGGTYPITVTGTGASGTETATYTLSVTSSGGGSTALVNGGFESGSLSPWTCQPGDSVVSSPVHSGGYAAEIAPTDAQTGECDQTVTLAPNTSYTLTGWVEGDYAYIGVSGGATASTWASSSGWTQLSVPFTTGSSGTVTVYVHGWYAQGNVYADDFTLG